MKVAPLVLALIGLAACSPPDAMRPVSQANLDADRRADRRLATYERMRSLRDEGRLTEALAVLRTLAVDDQALWRVGAPLNDMTTYYDAGRELVVLLLAQGRVAEADRYLANLARSDGEGPAYDYELARAQVLQAQARWGEAEAIYRELKSDFPQSGYGTFSEWFFMWEAEIDIGMAETLVARSATAEALALLNNWTPEDLGKLGIRWALANEAALTSVDGP